MMASVMGVLMARSILAGTADTPITNDADYTDDKRRR